MRWLLLFLLTSPVWAQPSVEAVRAEVERALPGAVAEYRWFHAHPELSGEEKETSARLASLLEGLGMEVHRGIGGHGLVAFLRSGPGPVVLYRADMDALPVTEATGLDYASTNPGVMHACGHDIHMANAVGTLAVMKALAGSWQGTIVFVGQPAEEAGAGARRMLEDPAFKRLVSEPPRLALALHDTSALPAGEVELLEGFVSANVDSVDITVHGRGGHGAHPSRAVDPIVMGAEMVLSLQTIVSRRLEPGERAVVTVGRFSGGSKHNIIPPDALLQLTVRSYGDEVREFLLEEIRRVAVNVAQAHGAPQDPDVIVLDDFVPSVYNDPTWTRRLSEVFAGALGRERVKPGKPSTGGEDFGEFPRRLGCPGVMFRLGAVLSPEGAPGLHSDRFAPAPEPTLATGMLVTSLALLEALR